MSTPALRLDGRVVAITGGARGIGRATAAALVQRGARVAIGDLDVDLAREAADGLGPNAIAVRLDVTDRDSFGAFIAQAEVQLGPLHTLVNNAGIMLAGRVEAESDASTRRVIDVNVHGVILGSKLALGVMLPRGRGHIVNVASQAGTLERPRLNVHVPRSGGVVIAAMNATPSRIRPLLEHVMGIDHGLINIDPASRSDYETRAAGDIIGVRSPSHSDA